MASDAPTTIAFAVWGPIARDDLPGLCDRVCALLKGRRGDVDCLVLGVEADAVTVDALARLQLGARRSGCRVWLHGTTPELRELIAMMGLEDVFAE